MSTANATTAAAPAPDHVLSDEPAAIDSDATGPISHQIAMADEAASPMVTQQRSDTPLANLIRQSITTPILAWATRDVTLETWGTVRLWFCEEQPVMIGGVHCIANIARDRNAEPMTFSMDGFFSLFRRLPNPGECYRMSIQGRRVPDDEKGTAAL